MAYTIRHLAKVIDVLRREGIDGVIIGNTCLYIETKSREFEGDVDLFVTTLSPLLEEDKLREIAHRNHWSTGLTELGTLSLVVNVDGIDIVIELYENIHDFYIPEEALNICTKKIIVEGVEIKYVLPSCWAVFKARRGANKDLHDLRIFKDLVDRGEIDFDTKIVRKLVSLYEEDSKYIVDRLRSIGIEI